jgi:predicted tellurium resistance membrane protein TerC
MDWLSQPDAWIALATLTLLEIVLGIDNIVFISILSDKVREDQRGKARQLGLAIAMLTRIALLFSIVWVMRLTAPLFTLIGHEFSGRDLILIGGGLFLLYKATHEIHEKLEGEEQERKSGAAAATLGSVIVQIAIIDIVFSLDSVITAVGMAEDVGVMVTAVILAVGFMMLAAGRVSSFVSRHPTVKMLALSFLLLIGMSLVAEGFGQHIAKGYIYFAMGFSIFVEAMNLRMTKKGVTPVHLHNTPYDETTQTS